MSKFGEPWQRDEDEQGWLLRIKSADGMPSILPELHVATDDGGCVSMWLELSAEDYSSGGDAADRAIACVNACAGMADPTAVPDLLAALTYITEHCTLYGPADAAREMAAKAIAKAGGNDTSHDKSVVTDCGGQSCE